MRCVMLAGGTQVFSAEIKTNSASTGYCNVVPYMNYIAQAKGNILMGVLPSIVLSMATKVQRQGWKSALIHSNTKATNGLR